MSKTKNDLLIENWNLKNNKGSKVRYLNDFGEIHETITTSEAWVMGGTPVIMLKGVRGVYTLSRVQAIH